MVTPEEKSRKWKRDSWFYLGSLTLIICSFILLVMGEFVAALMLVVLLVVTTAITLLFHKIQFGRWW